MPNAPISPAGLRSNLKISWGFVVLGALTIVCAGSIYLRERQFVTRATHVEGKIVGNLYSRGKSTDRYNAIFTFVDGSGKTWKATDRDTNSHGQPFVNGQGCTVLYDPDKPAAAQLETSGTFLDLLGYGLIALIAGVIFSGLGIYLLRTNAAALRRQLIDQRDPAILEGP